MMCISAGKIFPGEEKRYLFRKELSTFWYQWISGYRRSDLVIQYDSSTVETRNAAPQTSFCAVAACRGSSNAPIRSEIWIVDYLDNFILDLTVCP